MALAHGRSVVLGPLSEVGECHISSCTYSGVWACPLHKATKHQHSHRQTGMFLVCCCAEGWLVASCILPSVNAGCSCSICDMRRWHEMQQPYIMWLGQGIIRVITRLCHGMITRLQSWRLWGDRAAADAGSAAAGLCSRLWRGVTGHSPLPALLLSFQPPFPAPEAALLPLDAATLPRSTCSTVHPGLWEPDAGEPGSACRHAAVPAQVRLDTQCYGSWRLSGVRRSRLTCPCSTVCC